MRRLSTTVEGPVWLTQMASLVRRKGLALWLDFKARRA